jgi:septal ring factor EnvC (AmiA/AmiB activator)
MTEQLEDTKRCLSQKQNQLDSLEATLQEKQESIAYLMGKVRKYQNERLNLDLNCTNNHVSTI